MIRNYPSFYVFFPLLILCRQIQYRSIGQLQMLDVGVSIYELCF